MAEEQERLDRWNEPMALTPAETSQDIGEAWEVFFETGDESLLVAYGIFAPDGEDEDEEGEDES